MSDEDIPKIGPELTPPIELIVNNQYDQCHHRCYVVNAKDRSVTCSNCGALVDAFDAMLHIAKEGHNQALNKQHVRNEIRELEQRHELIKQVVQRIKQEARRLGVPLSLVNYWDTGKLAETLSIDKELLERAKVVDANWARRRKVATRPRLIKGRKE